MGTLRTAICRNESGSAIPVQCRFERLETGALQATKVVLDRLRADHPELVFEDWGYQLATPADANVMRMFFLSPCVVSVRKWIEDNDGWTLHTITRQDVTGSTA